VRGLTLRKIEDRERLFKLADLTVRLAARLGVVEPQLTFVRWGALLHDVGKINIPDQVLFKTEPLNDDDWQSLRTAPELAHQLLSVTPALRPALAIPYGLYERWEGNGYPDGLKGEAIPFFARIFAVANAWEAMQTERPYRPALTAAEARQYLEEQTGKQFDPQVVQAFLTLEDI
jgi:response regulator RpfG family c-di-GMP phosphodiesterase